MNLPTMNYRRRYYDPVIGRFTSRDPLGYILGELNLYTYTHNSPVNFTDPYGLYWGEDQINWWLHESAVPGPYGQPMSEWGQNGPTGWGDPVSYTEKSCGTWHKPAERIALGTAVAATSVAIAAGTGAIPNWSIGWKGGEITLTRPGAPTPDWRFNPLGSRGSQNPYGRRPHYHRREIDPVTGKTKEGGGVGNHRPWERGW